MEYKTCLAFVFILSVVRCNQCGEKDLSELFISNSGLCHDGGEWTFSDASVSIDKHNDLSNFLTPGTKLSCVTSKTLSLSNLGVLEVKVYSKSITEEDYLTVLVYEAEGNNVVGQASFSEEENEVNDGWHVLKVTLGGVGYYNGYITLIGKSSLNSDILVASICYSPYHKENSFSKDTATSTSDYKGPDIYALHTGSALIYPVHPSQETDINKVDMHFENRSLRIFNMEDFWTPLTISLAVIIPVIFLALLSWACFALGKKSGAKQDPQSIYEDVDNLPKPYIVPRVKSVYAESVAGSSYGGRNNIYSV